MSIKYSDIIGMRADLPPDLFNRLAETQTYLELVSVDLISVVKTFFRASPPLRKHFYRCNLSSGNEYTSRVLPYDDENNEQTDQLKQLLRLLDFF